MSRMRILAGTLGIVALTTIADPTALAATPIATPAPVVQAAPDNRATAHASLWLDVPRTKVWVGQAVPVTLQAYFRGAEGVTLEGGPQLLSSGIFTSDLASEPRQSTQMVGGVPVLVATWTGTVTPSSAAPLALVAELPVRVRYREAAPQVEPQESPFGDDPFAGFPDNPFDMSAIRHFLRQSMAQAMGRAHEEVVTLRTSARPIEVQELPTAGQPASFTGAIGRFNLKASVPAAILHVSEPVTLRVVVDGQGDLDRVDLTGVATSDTWKTYSPKSTVEPAARGRQARKVFEQVLVPLRGGELTVPAVALTSFDPEAGRYVTRETAPLVVTVDGTALAAQAPPPSATPSDSPPGLAASLVQAAAPPAVPREVSPWRVAVWLSPLPFFVAAAAVWSRARRHRAERALLRAMRKAASRGEPIPFYKAAQALIATRLSSRWGVRSEDVNAIAIRDRLGPLGNPLAEALAADEALRFGRARLETPNLVPLCSSIEHSLGGAS